MRIVIPTTGSRGDVQPFVAFAVGLRAAGHNVCIATHADFEPFVRSRGLGFHAIEDGARAMHASAAGSRMVESGSNPFAFMREYATMRKALLSEFVAGTYQAARSADLMLITTTAALIGRAVAEKLELPVVALHCLPAGLTSQQENCLFPAWPKMLPGRRCYHLLSHLAAGEYLWQMQREAFNEARRDVLDLPPLPFLGPSPVQFRETPSLYGFSTAVLPRPTDWGSQHHVTGYWFLDGDPSWRPPAELEAFLQEGPPPVAIGFGSMACRDAEAMTRLVTEALEQSGQRGVLLTGWGGLRSGGRSSRVFEAEAIPHAWLYPRCAAVVHHGGAGTAAASLRAGVPSVVVPCMADQPFWGRRLEALGVAPRAIPRRSLTASRLAAAITTAAGSPDLRRRAQAVSRRIEAVDGVRVGVDIFHEILHDMRIKPWLTPVMETAARRWKMDGPEVEVPPLRISA